MSEESQATSGFQAKTAPAKGIVAITALSPPAAGLALIAIVIEGSSNSMITESPAVAVAALLVGALLILGSATLYCRYPENFLAFSKTFSGHQQASGGSVSPSDSDSGHTGSQ